MAAAWFLAAVPAGPWWADWRLDPSAVAVLFALGSAYAAGVVRTRRAGAPWPGARTAAFVGGLALAGAALVSPIEAYAEVSFSVHMVQHLLLTFGAPPLLALGAPVTLALRSLPSAAARRLSGALGSGPMHLLAMPVVAWAAFVGAPWAVHFSPLFDVALRSSVWHTVEHVIWVVGALALWWPVVGADPTPHPWTHPTRLLALFLAMPAMSFLALAIFAAAAPLYPTYAAAPAPWGPAALASQRDAAVWMWVVGNLGLVLAMLIVAADWKRHDDARQRRLEARQDAAAR